MSGAVLLNVIPDSFRSGRDWIGDDAPRASHSPKDLELIPITQLNAQYVPYVRQTRVLLSCATLSDRLLLLFLRKSWPRRPTKWGRRNCAAHRSASYGWHRFPRLAESRFDCLDVGLLITMIRTSRRTGQLSWPLHVVSGKASANAYLINRMVYLLLVRYL